MIDSSSLDLLKTLVEHETPSGDKPALDAMAASLAERFRALGGEASRIANPRGGDHLRVVFGPTAPASAPPILVLGHFDTVWPSGTVVKRPFRVESDRASGPGVYDMKAGIVILLEALRIVGPRIYASLPRSLEILLTSDEEIGSPESRRWIEAAARSAAIVLVLEPPLPGGALKTARKGVGRFTVRAIGKEAHAGVEPEKGVNAIEEMAHQILMLRNVANPEEGTTLNVGVIAGGTTPNVVPGQATAEVDVRASFRGEADRVEKAIRDLRPALPGVRIEVSGGFNRPPMERTQAIASLFEKAAAIAATLGMPLAEGSTGGGSDGNFTAALGVPTLDGLGADGGALTPNMSISCWIRSRDEPNFSPHCSSDCDAPSRKFRHA